MTPQFRLTQPAMRDIQEITDYLAQKSGFSQSETFIQKMNAQFARIVQFPRSGKPRNDLLPGSRMVSIDRYLIFYISIGEDIEILRVVNGYRDLSALFPETPTDE